MFGFGSGVKNKKFDYIPQHYDPAEESLRTRMAKYGETELSDTELAKERIRSGFKLKARGNKEALREGKKKSNIRLLIVAIFLIVGSMYVIRSDGFIRFVNGILT